MTRPVLVLWDLDLTLLRPAGFGARMIAPALAEFLGREPVVAASFAGRTDRAILTDLLEANGVVGPDDDVVLALMDTVATRCERFSEDLVDSGGGPLPGAHDAVRALASVPGLHQGIVTGNMRRTALLKLRVCGFGDVPDPALGAFGDHHLHRADVVREAMRVAGDRGPDVPPARTVIIGDHTLDVRGALDAGVRCVGVATGLVTADDLRAAGAHAVLPDLTDADLLLDALGTATR